jgi:hypothetical protein
MPKLIPNEGEVKLLSDIFDASAREDWYLKLIKADFTATETFTAASVTFADFDGYSDKTLTRTRTGSTWQAPASQSPSGGSPWSAETNVAYIQYGTAAQSWTCTGTGNTIYGYAYVGVSSGKLIAIEKFDTPRPLSNGDSLSILPTLELA